MHSAIPLYASTALGALIVALSACSGLTSGSLPAQPQGAAPLSGSATPTPIPFSYQTVDDPNSNVNRVTGINQLGKIVGWYGGGSGSGTPESYTAEPPYTKFTNINYPGAQSTTATGLTSNYIDVGFVTNPKNLPGVWAFLRIKSLWTLIKFHGEGSGQNAVTQLLGMNDSELGVGYYLNDSGVSNAFALNGVTEQFTAIKPPDEAGAAAYGINGKGDISGTETTTGGKTEGFFLETGTYYQFTYPGAKVTEGMGLNWQDQIVGDYEDPSGGIHGFILTDPQAGSAKRIWQSIDEPNASGTTVVTDINDNDQICGWYVDSAGNIDGFVATPK